MSAKYANRQRVKIILVKNQHLNPKYEGLKFQEYISETGEVVDSQWVGISELNQSAFEFEDVKDNYYYTVRLDKDGSEIKGIPEDALEAIK